MSQGYTVKGETLTIESNNADLKDFNDKIDTIVVSGNVTDIPPLPYELLEKVEKVVFCEGIGYIDSTFRYCKRLKCVEFPQSLSTIGSKAFQGCTALKEVSIPGNVKNILNEAFAECINLRNVNGDLFDILHIDVFSDTKFIHRLQRNRLIIHDGLVLDGSQCRGDVVIPSGTREIVAGSFKNNINIRSITIPEGVRVSHTAFQGCINLEEATLPADLTTISENLFCDCFKLKTINFSEAVTKVYADAFTNTLWLQERQKDNAPLILNGILVDGRNCKGDISITGVSKIADKAFWGNLEITGVTICDECESIGVRSFYDCCFLNKVILPSRLKEIGKASFFGCDHLEEIVIPDGVETIPYNAFNGCLSLSSITFPRSLKKIQNWAFSNCKQLKDKTIPQGVSVDDEAFATTSSRPLSLIQSAKGGKSIASRCYNNRKDLFYVVIPEGVTTIKSYAFSDCENLRKVVFPKSLKKIAEGAFKNCKKLEKIDLPKGIEIIESYAFENTGLKKVVLPAGLKKVDSAFSSCSNLLLVDIQCEKENVKFNYYGLYNLKSICCNGEILYPSSQQENTGYSENVTPPLYWHIFSFIYLLVAGCGIWSHFSGINKLVNASMISCITLLPLGYIVDAVAKKCGLWKNVKTDKVSILGNLLYAPALLVPLLMLFYLLNHFYNQSFPTCFLIATAAVVSLVLIVDTCLNIYKEKLVFFFQELYEGIYKIIHDYVWTPLKKYVLEPFGVYILDPLLKYIEWFYKHAIKPLYKRLKRLVRLFKPIGHFIKEVLRVIINCIKGLIKKVIVPFVKAVVNPVIKFVYDYVVEPLFEVVKWFMVDIFYEYFLKYILKLVNALIMLAGGFFKVVLGWVVSDANGVVNYFITIPLIILAIIGGIIYAFF